MLAKKYRLREKEVKKVLQKGKPFFSYNLAIKYFPSKISDVKFAIVIGWKSVSNNVVRNFYRRKFYDFCKKSLEQLPSWYYVCVIKKSFKLEKTFSIQQQFESEISYLFHKKLWKNI